MSFRWLKVFYDPERVGEDLAERPNFWPLALTVTAITLALILLMGTKIQALQLYQLEKQAPHLSPEQLEQAKRAIASFGKLASLLNALSPWIIWLVVALLIKLYALGARLEAPFLVVALLIKLYALGARLEAPFGVCFALAVYGYMPIWLGSILTYLFIRMAAGGSPREFQPQPGPVCQA